VTALRTRIHSNFGAGSVHGAGRINTPAHFFFYRPGKRNDFLVLIDVLSHFPGNYFILKASHKRANCTRLKEEGGVSHLSPSYYVFVHD
jgi:hypothetical protein